MARKSRKNIAEAETPQKPRMKVWKAALYIRLSVEFNGKRGDSLETQRQIMEAYLAVCPDIEIEGVYIDNGITGRTFEREAFQRMLDDIEAGKINCIVVKDLSRLGRNTIDTGYYIEKYFPLHQVRFIAVNDQYDSEDSENSGNHLIVPLKNTINEAYAADISRKVKAQQRQAMKDGEFVGARPPYGYRKDPDNCHHLLVNEDTAPVVRQIFQWTAEGVPLNMVVKKLNESNILSPGHYLLSIGLITSPRLAGGGVWQNRTVTKILEDEVYIGNMVQGKHNSVGHKQIPTKPNEWIIVPNTHEPLIDRNLFARANAVRAQVRQKNRDNAPIVPYTENILRGRIFCGHCGRHLNRRREGTHGSYSFYCLTNERIKTGACVGSPRIQEKALFKTIIEIICQQAKAVIGNRLYLQQQDHKIFEDKENTKREISKLQQRAENIRRFLTGLLESFNNGLLTSTEYLEMKENYSHEIQTVVDRIQDLQSQQMALECQMERYISLADRLAAIGEDTALSAQLVDQLIERVVVNGPNEISVRFTFESGFERVMEVLADE